jgi:hypothetical protein
MVLRKGVFGDAAFVLAGDARVDFVADAEGRYCGAYGGDGAGGVVADLVGESGARGKG